MARLTHFSLLALAATLLGCGHADYDQLITQRVSYLRNPPPPSTPEWERFQSAAFGYTLEAPSKPKVTADTDTGTETLAMPVGGSMYQLVFAENAKANSLDEAQKTTQALWEGQGYTLEKLDEEDLGDMQCARMRLTKQDSEDVATVRVCYFDDKKQTCVLAIAGTGWVEPDMERFMASFRRGR